MATKLGFAEVSGGQVVGREFSNMVSASILCQWLLLIHSYRGGITLLHIPCNSFASLFVVRFLLGLSEACIVPAFLLSMSMFFTYQEQAVMMPIMWSIGNASPITSGLLSYGVLWIKTDGFAPWRWFMGWFLLILKKKEKLILTNCSYHRRPHGHFWCFCLSFVPR